MILFKIFLFFISTITVTLFIIGILNIFSIYNPTILNYLIFNISDDKRIRIPSPEIINYYIDHGDSKIAVWEYRNTGPIIFYIHGVHTNRSYKHDLFHELYMKGLHIISIDVCGYGDSSSEKIINIKDIADNFYFLYKKYLNFFNKEIIIYGHSMGSSISLNLIKRLLYSDNIIVKKGIIECSFVDIRNVLKEKHIDSILYNIEYVLNTLNFVEFSNLENIKYLDKTKVLLIHSNNDFVIKVNNTEVLYSVCKNCMVNYYDVGGHSNIFFQNKDYVELVYDFVNKM